MATTKNGIYYQNNYDAAADVLEDMKKMAESIDGIVEENNNTQIQQNANIEQINGAVSNLFQGTNSMMGMIRDIQQKDIEQDTNIQSLQEEISELEEDVKANSIIVTTEEATSLQVNDASGARAKLNIKGNYRQKTREGYNLLNVPAEYEVVKNFKRVVNSFEAGTYTIKATSVTTDNNAIQRFLLAFEDEAGATFGQSFLYKTTLKTTAILSKKAVAVRIYSADNWDNTAVTTTTFKELMIYSGTDEKSYEEYGKTPSRRFPSEVETVYSRPRTSRSDNNKIQQKFIKFRL